MVRWINLSDMGEKFEKGISTAMEKALSTLKKRDPRMYSLVSRKMDEILGCPNRYELLSGNLNGYRRAHVGTNKILLYSIKDRVVTFQRFGDYDVIYKGRV